MKNLEFDRLLTGLGVKWRQLESVESISGAPK